MGDNAGAHSEIDILVTLPGARGWSGYGGVLRYLEGLFDGSVDLVVGAEARGELRSYNRGRRRVPLRALGTSAFMRSGFAPAPSLSLKRVAIRPTVSRDWRTCFALWTSAP